jgi:hypothetical protein
MMSLCSEGACLLHGDPNNSAGALVTPGNQGANNHGANMGLLRCLYADILIRFAFDRSDPVLSRFRALRVHQ